jgi:polygalacturonase
MLRPSLLLLACCSATLAVLGQTEPPYWGGDPIAPIRAPFPMPQLERPVFPARVFDIREHGAIPGGEVKNTEAFARAIAACVAAGGGRVLVPAGVWFTGPIHLQSNVELHLDEGSEIKFSDRFADYLPVVLVRVGGIELYNYSPLIYARDCENIAITGPGRLNGNANAWWPWKPLETKEIFTLGPRGVPVEERIFGTEEAAIRPSFVSFVNCRNVLLEGFTIGSGPNWTIHPIYCENVIIRRVIVDTNGPNNDGIDPDSCRNVLIEHCRFNTGDDCVVLKSGYNEDGWRVGKPTENVVMRWCYSNKGHGGLVIGSEMSGDVRNVYMHDCEFDGTDRAVRIKSRRGRGGVVENVWAENLTVRNMRREVVIMNMDYSSDRNAAFNERAPLFRNIHIRNIRGEGAPVAMRFTGMEDSAIENVTFENIRIAATQGILAEHVKGFSFHNVQIAPEKGPAFDLNEARDVVISGSRAHPGVPFLRISGQTSENIRIRQSDLAGATEPFQLGQGVRPGIVTVE